MIRRLLVGIFGCFLWISCSEMKGSEEVIAEDKKVKDESGYGEKAAEDSFKLFLEYYDRFFETNFQISECPGAAVVIIKDTTTIYKKAFGVKQIHTQDSVNESTVFRIASLSKGMSAILAANLEQQNELNWNQKIKEVVPDFSLRNKRQANEITVTHVLSHTAGLYKYSNSKLIHKGFPLSSIIKGFRSLGTVADVGTEYAYQNAVFSLVEKVMEHNTGKTFQELLNERIFRPAQMLTASSSYQEIKANNNIALPHKWNDYNKKYYLTSLHPNYYNVAAAGGINASITDMEKYLQIVLGNRPEILNEEGLKDVFNPVICTTNDPKMYVNLWEGVTDSFYAKGWRVLNYHNRTIYYHGGNVNQYKGQIMVDPENKIAMCVLFNAPNPFNGSVIPTFLNYYDFFNDFKNKKTAQ